MPPQPVPAGRPVSPVAATPLAKSPLPFAVGQRLSGRVVRLLPDGEALLVLGGQPVRAALGPQVAVGQPLQATVLQTAPRLLLQVTLHGQQAPAVSPPVSSQVTPLQPFAELLAGVAQHVLSSAWLRQQAPQLHQRLAETLSLLQPETLPDATALAAQVKLSGLNYEAALWRLLGEEGPEPTDLAADLKGQLLALRQRLAVLRTPAANVVLEHVEEALRQLERYQLANLFAQQQHQPLLVPLLLPSEVTRQTAWLLVHREGHRQRHDPQARWALSLILPTTALGELHVEARLQGAALATTLYVERPEVATYLEPHLPALAAQLQALGFQAHVACRLLPPVEAASAEAPGPQAPSVDCRV